jgi:hypothetical protein
MSATHELLGNAEHDASTRVVVLAHRAACGTARFSGVRGFLHDVGKGKRRQVR